MPDLTPDQRQRVDDLLDGARDQIANDTVLIDSGEVADHARPTAYRALGMSHRKAAICLVYRKEVGAAREQFAAAAQAFQQGAEEGLARPVFATAHQRVPMTYVEGLYVGAVAGARDTVDEITTAITELEPVPELNDTDPNFAPDTFYLAQCLAEAVLDTVESDNCETLATINTDKPEREAHYGHAIYEFATGIDQDDQTRIETSVQSMLTYHKETLNPNNVLDLIMSVKVTALSWLARQHGYKYSICSVYRKTAPVLNHLHNKFSRLSR